MKVYVGSTNPSKIDAVRIALETLGYAETEIFGVETNSGVGSKPDNYEIQLGARNRNEDLYRKCVTVETEYDYLISIEGGLERDDENYYLVTYASVIDGFGKESMGKSIGLPVTARIYDFYRKGNSINKVIERVMGTTNNKKGSGISGYFSDDIFRRSKVDSDAVIAALLPLINEKKYREIDEEITKVILEKKNNK